MIPLRDYMEQVRALRVPEDNPHLPDLLRLCGQGGAGAMLEHYRAREECSDRGMWPVVAMPWVRELAAWLAGRNVLEVMAGGGWIAAGLAKCGVDVLATDDYRWDTRHKLMVRVHPVAKAAALDAVRAHRNDREVLLISWPYMNDDAAEACAEWPGPIVYIGEGSGGCNASDAFFRGFREDEGAPAFDLVQWPGIHDNVQVGRWSKTQEEPVP